MPSAKDRIGWMVASGLATLAVRKLVTRGMDAGWRAALHEDPPERGGARDHGAGRALGWAVGTAVVFATAEFLAREGVASLWERFTGEPPPE